MRWRRAITAAAFAAGLLAAAGCGGEADFPDTAWPGQPGTPRAEIVVDLVRAHYGRVPVAMRVIGVDGQDGYQFTFRAVSDEYRVHGGHFTDGEGRTIAATRRGPSFNLQPFEGDVVEARWEAEPGGLGRHGLQGVLRDDFAAFDGRLYLMPEDASRLVATRIHFAVPWGWEAVTPFRREGEWHYLDIFDRDDTVRLLQDSCVGVGRFDLQTRRMGDMEVRVGTYSKWDGDYKAETTDSTFRILEYFHDELGFDLKAPYAVVWLPMVDGYRVHGGSSVTGTCLENPDGKLRPFQLLAHRVSHCMDKYKPAGMQPRERHDKWFREGWPSYMEVQVTEATGVATGKSFFNTLFTEYKAKIARKPDYDVELAREPEVRGQLMEFIHYKKAPLVAKMLAHLVETRSGRTLEEFMRVTWAKHGWYRGRFDLRNELEEFAGKPFDDFWGLMVDAQGQVVPCWNGYVTDKMRTELNRPPAVRVGGKPVSSNYVHHLAKSGEFASFTELREFLVAEEARRRALAERGVELYPDEIRRHLFSLPPEDRSRIAKLEAAYPFEDDPAAGSSIRFEINRDHEHGRLLASLLELERDYEAATERGPLSAVGVRIQDQETIEGDRLAFGVNAPLLLLPRWRSKPEQVEIEMLVDGEPAKTWELDRPVPVQVDSKLRLGREGIVAFRVSADGRPPVTRGYWQKGFEPRSVRRSRAPSRTSLRDPDNPEAWYRDALTYLAVGRHEQALEFLVRAIEMDPDDAVKWYKHGEILAKRRRYEEALGSFDQALALDSRYMAAAGEKGLVLAALGRREESLAALDFLVSQNPQSPFRIYYRGRILNALGDFQEALTAFRTFVAMKPDRVEGWRQLGHCYVKVGRHKKALDAFKRALALDPSDQESRLGRQLAQRMLQVKQR